MSTDKLHFDNSRYIGRQNIHVSVYLHCR